MNNGLATVSSSSITNSSSSAKVVFHPSITSSANSILINILATGLIALIVILLIISAVEYISGTFHHNDDKKFSRGLFHLTIVIAFISLMLLGLKNLLTRFSIKQALVLFFITCAVSAIMIVIPLLITNVVSESIFYDLLMNPSYYQEVVSNVQALRMIPFILSGFAIAVSIIVLII